MKRLLLLWVVTAGLMLLFAATFTPLSAQNPFTLFQWGASVDTNSGSKSGNTLRVVIATDQPALTNPLKVDGSGVTQPVSGTFWQATQPVSIASGQVASGAIASGAIASGAVASGAFASGAIGSGAIASGAVASGAVASGAFASGSLAAGACAVGCLPPASGVLQKGAITSAMTGTTSTQVIAAVASNYLYITSCAFSNTHASVTTMETLQDGSGGTTIWEGVNPFGAGSNVVFPTPLKVPTLGNGLYVANVTTGSNTFVSCSGFSSTTSY